MIASPQTTGPKPKSKPNQPINEPYKPTAPRKANQQKWRKGFRGRKNGLEFFLNIERKSDGSLHARYWVHPGSSTGWQLTGNVHQDNTFILRGIENSASFEGRFTTNAVSITANFAKGGKKIGGLQLAQAPLRLPSNVKPVLDGPKPESTSNPSVDAVVLAAQALAKKLGKPFNRTQANHHVSLIISACSTAGITDINQMAYVFATAVWESSGFTAYYEKYMPGWTAKEYFEQAYGPNPTRILPKDARRLTLGVSATKILETRKRRNLEELGNTEPGDGHRFRGRGYVHLTGRANYARAQQYAVIPSGIKRNGKVPNLLENPDLAASDSEIAAIILAKGMATGSFTGTSLKEHINSQKTDFIGARKIINDRDEAARIATGADTFASAIRRVTSDDQDGDPTPNTALMEITANQEQFILKIPVAGYSSDELKEMRSGVAIGSLNGINAYFNGPDEAQTWGDSYSKDGTIYYGFKWQCVEFVRRYTSMSGGKYISHRGNASTFYKSSIPDGGHTFDAFTQYRNTDPKTGAKIGSIGKPKPGDIIVLSTNTYGHVAVIAEVGDEHISIAQQNVLTNFKEEISLKKNGNRWVVGGKAQCWLRHQ
ncbi:CHAP domain-containing protein [Deinococcus deserti]|uniref:Putative amidase n=1 Tax=Deinococcus deserti (strain DSM 17065 / CIP 109153 / LMG 22923 / VCD115) TaxID=546414 RepID=C1CXW6_DEIDV|nr:CHAP domain-containing protein [Deinococcus deserti]ACO46922.1 putative amidase [Deinococcus deserti VCD115]